MLVSSPIASTYEQDVRGHCSMNDLNHPRLPGGAGSSMAAEVARASDLPAWAEKYIGQPEHASSRQSPETSGGLVHALIEDSRCCPGPDSRSIKFGNLEKMG